MPIYEYACDQCSHRFEKIVPNMDAAVSCPTCQNTPRRLPSVFSSPGNTPAPQTHGCGGGCSCFPSN